MSNDPMVDVGAYESTIKELRIERENLKKLVTELCDALKKSHVLFSGELHDLIQRAREATR